MLPQTSNQTPILQYILAPHPHLANQMLESIKTHPQYNQICDHIIYALSESDEGLPTVNADYISMKLCEVSLSNNCKSQQLNMGIQRLQELEMKLDCLIQELEDRKQWVNKKANQFQKNQEQTKQDCEILAHQNSKLFSEIEEKQNKDSGNLMNKAMGGDQKRQLEDLLKKYNCGASGFPKNKNEAIRLLNSLEVKLQSLQVEKLGFL